MLARDGEQSREDEDRPQNAKAHEHGQELPNAHGLGALACAENAEIAADPVAVVITAFAVIYTWDVER